MTNTPGTGRLFGVPDAENLYDELADAYETQIEPEGRDDNDGPWVIEEWSAAPPIDSILSADRIVEWLLEAATDDASDGFYETTEHLHKDLVVLAAAEALRTAIADRITYRMADKRLAEHTITWDENGEPLVNGQPLYVPAKANS